MNINLLPPMTKNIIIFGTQLALFIIAILISSDVWVIVDKNNQDDNHKDDNNNISPIINNQGMSIIFLIVSILLIGVLIGLEIKYKSQPNEPQSNEPNDPGLHYIPRTPSYN
jgi:hypothetical protein